MIIRIIRLIWTMRVKIWLIIMVEIIMIMKITTTIKIITIPKNDCNNNNNIVMDNDNE